MDNCEFEVLWGQYADLRDEIKEAQRQRIELFKAKMAFVGIFLAAIGTLMRGFDSTSQMPIEIAYTPAFFATLFDLLSHNCSRKIKEIGQYLREILEPCLKKELTTLSTEFVPWEIYEQRRRLSFDKRIASRWPWRCWNQKKNKIDSLNYWIVIPVILRSPAKIAQVGSTLVIVLPTVFLLVTVILKCFYKTQNQIISFHSFFAAFPFWIQTIILVILLVLTYFNCIDFLYQYKRARFSSKENVQEDNNEEATQGKKSKKEEQKNTSQNYTKLETHKTRRVKRHGLTGEESRLNEVNTVNYFRLWRGY